MNRKGLEDMILDTKKMLTFYEGIKADCTSCTQRGAQNKCLLHDAIVPDEYISQGCDQWEYDEVPF